MDEVPAGRQGCNGGDELIRGRQVHDGRTQTLVRRGLLHGQLAASSEQAGKDALYAATPMLRDHDCGGKPAGNARRIETSPLKPFAEPPIAMIRGCGSFRCRVSSPFIK